VANGISCLDPNRRNSLSHATAYMGTFDVAYHYRGLRTNTGACGSSNTSFAIEGKSADYFTLAAIIWAVLTLITQLDPLLTSKLEILKEAMNLFRPGDSEKQ
jgi:hypothetical protein